MLRLELTLPPSINAMYRHSRGRNGKGYVYMAEDAKAWKTGAQWQVKADCGRQGWKCTRGQKVRLTLFAYWPNKGRHDMNNLHKALCDALEGIVYDDDRYVLITDKDYAIDRQRPRLEVTAEIVQ